MKRKKTAGFNSAEGGGLSAVHAAIGHCRVGGETFRPGEQHYRALFNTSMDAVLLTAPNGRILAANEAACKMFGRSENELLKIGRGGVVDRSDPRLAPALEERARTGRFRGELTFIRSDGCTFDGEISSALFSDPDGQICSSMAIRDISERKRVENALAESEARYRQIVESATDAILVRSGDSVVYANPAALRLFRASHPDQLIGKSYLERVHPDDRPDSMERIRRGIEEGSAAAPREHRILTIDGETVEVESTGVAIQYQGQVRLFAVFRDISERKRLEVQFRQAQKMEAIGRLAGGVAHDFNNMLSVILGFTELAMIQLSKDNPIQKHLEEVSSAAQRSAGITRQLLAFARKQTIAPQILDLNDTIAGMLKILGRLIGEDIELLWKPGKNLWPVKVDPSQIDQILANLAVNARDAIDGVGKLVIETGNVEFDAHYCREHAGSMPGHYAMIAVSDNGCGMDRQTLAKLFEPFFTTKEVGKGTGLGLATIYGIVKQNNGFINVYSEPGHGTAFKIYLPRQESETAAAVQAGETAEAPGGTETVLLVEDEKSLLRFARILLEELGYTVLSADSPMEAIRLAQENAREIHLLMTDVVMPELNGRELWTKLKEARPDLKCLFMSGYTTSVIAPRGVLDQGVHFLEKPFIRRALARKLRETLSS